MIDVDFEFDEARRERMRSALKQKTSRHLAGIALILALPAGCLFLMMGSALFLAVTQNALWIIGVYLNLLVLLFLMVTWTRQRVDLPDVFGVETHRFVIDDQGLSYITPRKEQAWPWSSRVAASLREVRCSRRRSRTGAG